MAGRVRIGISGWRYAPWRGEFYPKGLRQADELAFAAQHFDTIELNGSFYSLQRPELYAAWYRATPPGFLFAVKGSRYITHMRRLRDVQTPLANFLASGILCLKEKLGPLLWQFPPTFPFDERLEPFLAALPRTTEEAAEMAKRHDARVPRAVVESGEPRELRHAVEVRHPSFRTPEFVAMLRRQGVGLVLADTAGHFPYFEDLSADFVYLRLHGDEKLYESGYTPQALERWADRVKAFRDGREAADPVRVSPVAPAPLPARDVYVYFDNDIKVHAPYDAQALAELVGGSGAALHPRLVRGPAGTDLAPEGTMATRKTARSSTKTKYGEKAQSKVERSMHEMKRGQLRSGGSGKKVTNPKQAIAIGLSEARRAGGKVPAKKKTSRRAPKSKSKRRAA